MRDVYADTPDAARYAGLWIRVFANALDGLALAAISQAAWYGRELWFMFSVERSFIGSVSTGGVGPFEAVASVLLPVVLVVGFWIFKGATPGKMICGLRIVDEATGGRPTAWQCIGRYFTALVAVLCGIGYLWIVIDPRRQGWHDKLVRTLVVRDGTR
jgi:uncharacterized RDD family membrane protein YckC